MATTVGTATLPVYVRVGDGKEFEVGTIELELDARRSGNGKIALKPPSQTEIKRALRKALR